MDENSKEYQKFVLNYSINKIKEDFNLKTKKEAEQWFYKALAYSTVQEELNNKINYLINECEK